MFLIGDSAECLMEFGRQVQTDFVACGILAGFFSLRF